jgi:hypothetical protein
MSRNEENKTRIGGPGIAEMRKARGGDASAGETGNTTRALLVVVVLAAAGAYMWLRPHPPGTAPRFATVEEARREAVRLYPALGQAGTRLNRDFVARYRLYQNQRPEFFRATDWPITLVEEVVHGVTASAAPESSGIPPHLEKPFAVLMRSYPKVDAKKFPLSPADSVWIFRASVGGSGTVEVGFQQADVVYMLFRRGVGGRSWTGEEISQLKASYPELLQDKGQGFLYRPTVLGQINAAAITRSDFDQKRLLSGQ